VNDMGRSLNPKDRAKMIYKRFKACSFDSGVFNEKFCPDKSKFDDYNKFVEDINLYNKFFGYIARMELK